MSLPPMFYKSVLLTLGMKRPYELMHILKTDCMWNYAKFLETFPGANILVYGDASTHQYHHLIRSQYDHTPPPVAYDTLLQYGLTLGNFLISSGYKKYIARLYANTNILIMELRWHKKICIYI